MKTPRLGANVRSARKPADALRFRPRVEQLEDRCLPSTTLGPDLSGLVAAPSLEGVAPLASSPSGSGLTPAQVRHAYGFDNIRFGNVAGDGTGQTIAIVTAYDDPTISYDLHVFDQTFGLSDPPKFTQISPYGTSGTNALWALETSLDVEWAHAIAPKAKILLVQAKSDGLGDMLSAVNYARNQPGVSVVSMSWGVKEFSAETLLDSYFNTPTGKSPITFVAASGDDGSNAASSWPGVASNVLDVGGTRLYADSAGNYQGETAWSGSTGLISIFENRPAYQSGFLNNAKRGAPDVAYDADSATGFPIYSSASYYGHSGWMTVGGTSAGAPQWAALVAIADQGRALQGKTSLGNIQSLIYQMPASDFHDITSGGNGAYHAGSGYDLVTGRGSPYANLVVSYLVGGASSAATAKTAPASNAVMTTAAAHFIGGDSIRDPSLVGLAGHQSGAIFGTDLANAWSRLPGFGPLRSDPAPQPSASPDGSLDGIACFSSQDCPDRIGTDQHVSIADTTHEDSPTLERDLAFAAVIAELATAW